MRGIFEKLVQRCSKLDGDYESYLYLGLIRPISSRYHCSAFVFLEKFSCKIFIYIFKIVTNAKYIHSKERYQRAL